MANKWLILYCDGNEWNADPLELGDVAEWTNNPEARIGDFGLTYAKSPVKAFVSIVKVLGNATRIDQAIPADDTYEATTLKDSAFLRPHDTCQIGVKRNSISGVIAYGIGSVPGICRGILHPNSARRFHPALLPNIEFGEVKIDQTSGQLQVGWP